MLKFPCTMLRQTLQYNNDVISCLKRSWDPAQQKVFSSRSPPSTVMGQTLSEPVTSKESSCCQNARFRVGSSCMQGWRLSMEDSHTHILSLPDDPGTAFFAVYDGHGGAGVSNYVSKHLHKFIINRPEYKAGDIPSAMKHAFLEMDQSMRNDPEMKNLHEGTTAVTVLIKGDQLYCANVGDSRAIACVNGKVEVLSLDHKPNNDEELKRIVAAGGRVDYNRVNGNLALSRALGDFNYKKNWRKPPEEQIVTAYPDVEVRTITKDWQFLVMACDGIWDVVDNEDVVNFVQTKLSEGHEVEEICEEMMNHCLSPDCSMGGLGCDNMTVLIVLFLHDGENT